MMRKPTDNIEYYELTITAGKYIKTIPICFPTDAAPFPAVLCLCESNYLWKPWTTPWWRASTENLMIF